MIESVIQARIIKRLEEQGYYVIKLIQTNKNGIPDLLILEGDGRCSFMEVKSGNGKLSELQKYRISQLEKINYHVFVVSDFDHIKKS